MTKNTRQGVFQRLVGKKKAEEVEKDLEEAKEQLDKLGVERKDEAAKNEETVAAAVAEALAAAGVKVDDELLQTILAAVIEGLEESAVAEEEMAGDLPDDEDEDEEEKEQVADLLKAFDEMTKDMGEMARQEVELIEVVKAIVPAIADIKTRQEALEKLLKQTPRQASKAQESTFEHKEIKKIVEEALRGTKGKGLFPTKDNGQGE